MTKFKGFMMQNCVKATIADMKKAKEKSMSEEISQLKEENKRLKEMLEKNENKKG